MPQLKESGPSKENMIQKSWARNGNDKRCLLGTTRIKYLLCFQRGEIIKPNSQKTYFTFLKLD